ncbi:MAG: hypothetical protein ABSE43_10370 [Steroidobacteraceae bacterium]|jgi:hypothetical protein
MAPLSLMPPADPPPPDPQRSGVIALLVIAALVLGGLFLVHVLRNAAQLQDCLLSGRTNCAPIDVPQDSNP